MNPGNNLNSYDVSDSNQNKAIRIPIPIKFRNRRVQYCLIKLCDLTRETFLEDGKKNL